MPTSSDELSERPEIDNLITIEDDELINQFNHISYQDLLDLDKAKGLKNIRVHNENKILNISLN